MKKVLVIGPDIERSRGGMATVIRQMKDSSVLNDKYDITLFSSYIDGTLPKRLFYNLLAYIRFLQVYKKYDLFHIHNASYGSTFRKRYYLKKIRKTGKPVIAHIHGAKYLVFYDGLKKAGKKKVLDYLKGADLVIALSEDWKEKFEETFRLDHIRALPNGMDTDLYRAAISDPFENHNHFVLLGRIGQRKGVYDLIQAAKIAAAENPAIRISIAGDGEVEKARDLVKAEGLEKQVNVIGWVDQAGKTALLKEAATLVLPSYYEGLPMSVLEGMAAGKAIISTRVGALPEVISEENGVLIEAGDTEALARALLHFSNDPALLAGMGSANRKKVEEEFSLRKMHETLLSYYDELLERK